MILQKQLSSYSMQFLLNAYKSGLYFTDLPKYSAPALTTIEGLTKTNYINSEKLNHSWYLITLTESGTKMVKDRFMERLMNGKIYQILPLLLIGDKISVAKTLINTPSDVYVRAPQNEIPVGIYNLMQIDRFSISLTENNTDVYKVKMYAARDFLTLQLSEIGTVDEEMSKRFGKIDVKYTGKEVTKRFTDNLKIMNAMNRLYELPSVQGRLEGDR